MTFTVSKTVSDETLNAIITIESAGRLNVKAPTSSALGLGQFLNATWMGEIKQHRPDLMEDRTEAQVLALRTDPQIAVEILARFTEDNQRIVGMNCTGGDLYLAHFLGAGTAQKVCASPPNLDVGKIVGSAAVAANRSILQGRTCAQVRAWAAKRMYDSRGHDWVAKYYTAPEATEPEAVAVDPEPEAIPDTQTPTEPEPVRPDPVPPVTPAPNAPADKTQIAPAPNEGFFDWIKRKAKTITGWITGGGGSIGVLGYLTDWRVVAVIMCGLIVAGFLAGVFYLLMRKKS